MSTTVAFCAGFVGAYLVPGTCWLIYELAKGAALVWRGRGYYSDPLNARGLTWLGRRLLRLMLWLSPRSNDRG